MGEPATPPDRRMDGVQFPNGILYVAQLQSSIPRGHRKTLPKRPWQARFGEAGIIASGAL